MRCEYCKKECKILGSHLQHAHHVQDLKVYYDAFIKTKDEGICPICSKETTFRGLSKGYLVYCSSKCSNSAKAVIDKKKNTTKEHFGSENYRNIEQSRKTRLEKYGKFNSDESRLKISATKTNRSIYELAEIAEKSRKTRLEKYSQWRAPDTSDKISATKFEKYGSSTYNNREKAEKTCLEKYGISHPSKIFLKNLIEVNDTAELIADNGAFVEILCNICHKTRSIEREKLINRATGVLCDECNPYLETSTGKSIAEQELSVFIKNEYNGIIYLNDRSLLDGKELDIYLPEKKLAFEFDGLYWHSDEFKDSEYHLSKTELCESKGVQLIHVFEDEWRFKQEIVKSRISGLLHKNNRIFARKCKVKEVSSKTATEFLNNNHIQGACSSKYRYGLYYNNELVSLMTFGKSRFKKDEFELLRFCNKLYTNVVGGASKLFKHFLKDHAEITKIISYADRRWSVGNLYTAIGFKKVKCTKPNYFYVKLFTRENRMKYQKHMLVEQGADPTKTEHEIMKEYGYNRIYDCGCIKSEYMKLN